MKTSDIPSDELKALANAHKCHGRKAKEMIRNAWFNGNYRAFDSIVDTSALQRFRNSEHGGPERLNSLSLSRIVIAEPVIAEPVIAEPVIAEPVIAEPVIAEPVIAEPVQPWENPALARLVNLTGEQLLSPRVIAEPVIEPEPLFCLHSRPRVRLNSTSDLTEPEPVKKSPLNDLDGLCLLTVAHNAAQILDLLGEPFPDVSACFKAGQSPLQLAESCLDALFDTMESHSLSEFCQD